VASAFRPVRALLSSSVGAVVEILGGDAAFSAAHAAPAGVVLEAGDDRAALADFGQLVTDVQA
jgi:hypothetical protein